MLQQLILVLVVEAVRQEDPAEQLDGVVEQLLSRIAGESIVDWHYGISVKVVFDADLGNQACILGEVVDAPEAATGIKLDFLRRSVPLLVFLVWLIAFL